MKQLGLSVPNHTLLRQGLRWLPPLLVGLGFIALWEVCVQLFSVPRFVLPAPSAIVAAFFDHSGLLLAATWVTFKLALMAFVLAVAGGTALAVLFSQSRLIEMSLFPYAVILQVTPVIAIAPLILIWVGIERPQLALMILAWIVAFFPILANMTLGLRSVDRTLLELFDVYGASRWQVLWRLRLPASLPYLFAGMKVAGGLSLIAVVTAEFVAGTGGSGGLAWRITEAGNRLEIARMFAALGLLSLLGILFYAAISLAERWALGGWHESAVREE